MSVLQVAHLLIDIIKGPNKYNDWIEYIEDRPFNDKRYYINNIKLKNMGWIIKKNIFNVIGDIVA